jgi:hypothetical protein
VLSPEVAVALHRRTLRRRIQAQRSPTGGAFACLVVPSTTEIGIRSARLCPCLHLPPETWNAVYRVKRYRGFESLSLRVSLPRRWIRGRGGLSSVGVSAVADAVSEVRPRRHRNSSRSVSGRRRRCRQATPTSAVRRTLAKIVTSPTTIRGVLRFQTLGWPSLSSLGPETTP